MFITRKQKVEQKKLILSFVVPVYNEEGRGVSFVRSLAESAAAITHHYEIIFIHDGRENSTLTCIEKELSGLYSVKFLSFSSNFGKESAITAGLHSLPEFFVVAIFGFLLSEGLYAFCLKTLQMDYRCGLVLVLLVVSFVMLLLSKIWVFR